MMLCFDAPFGGEEIVRGRFEGIERYAEAVRRLRPDMRWTGTQLAPGRVSGSLVGWCEDGIRFTCSDVEGTFELRGPVSDRTLVIGLGLDLGGGSRQFLEPAVTGTVALFQPGAVQHGMFRGRSAFVTIDIDHAELEQTAERLGLVVERRRLQAHGCTPGRIEAGALARISALVAGLHRGETPAPGGRPGALILGAMIDHLGRVPRGERLNRCGYVRIVSRARDYIDAHLDAPIAVDDLAAAAFASRRTLHRAFLDVLGETPQSYVLKLRLNRIREELATGGHTHRTITMVSHQWGMPELGRLAARYREQFGELPSDTVARRARPAVAHAA